MTSDDPKKNKNKKKNKKKESAAEGVSHDSNNHGSKVITDARFSSLHSDPRFQKVPRNQSKVQIDSRFNRMFSSKSFASSSAPVDKRGKPKKEIAQNPLLHYYRLEEEQELRNGSGHRGNVGKRKEVGNDNSQKLASGAVNSDSSSESEPDLSESTDELESDVSASTTSDTDDDSEVYSDEEPIVEENIPAIEQETHRLAVVNLDWSQVSASDLFVVMSSFLPKDGQILSVAVYPSDFGLKRMEEEAVHGPVDLFGDDKEHSDNDDDDDDDEIDNEKLRAYEKSRLRYYYAVVECDSRVTADYLYKACDGVEFERSSNVLDLRFIPDSMDFEHPPRDVATEAPTNYEGLDFHTRALQNSKILLSWDDDEPHRVKSLKQTFNADQASQLELKEFLASDESESDDDENEDAVDDQSEKKINKRDKYRALLQSGDGVDDGEDNDKDMEVTFNTGLEDISKRILEKKDKKSETVWESYLRKRSEKKKARKKESGYVSKDDSSDADQEGPDQPDDFFIEVHAEKSGKRDAGGKTNWKEKQHQEMDKSQEASQAELELLLADELGADKTVKGYNLKPKKGMGKNGEKETTDKIPAIDHDDPRFSALFISPLFALDPTDPQYKRSAAYARQLVQKQQKGGQEEIVGKEPMKSSRQDKSKPDEIVPKIDEQLQSGVIAKKEKHDISSLVRSIKRKSQQVQLSSGAKVSNKDESWKLDGMPMKKEKNELSSLVQSVKKKARVLQS